ncbi:MAG: hypothetical protein NTY20_00705 [Candidatus Aenigmarchaeota archaeon]|nr:hypothetical protein [Candidatus Aenigmarchaeota archaeon]
MLAVHRIFQMIFGIIVSFTILYFLITYSGDYAGVQKDKQRAEILVSFSHDVRSVYLTGISTNFTYFSRYDFSSCFVNATEKSIPEIICLDSRVSRIPIETPVIFKPGQQVYIGRDSLDYGWWICGFAEAIPSTTFVFAPENTDEAWEVMTNIVQHLPDTSDDWSVVKVTFAFCDGPQILYVCGGRPCDKSDFLSILSSGPLGASFSPCTADLKGKRLVTISGSCGSEKGVCINPPNSKGVGNAFVEGSGKTYVYKDPLDLVALSVGGSEKDDFGRTEAEKIYGYKNSVLMPRISLAAEVMSKRSVLIAGDIPEETGCGAVYIELSQVLDRISPSMDYTSVSDMYNLNDNLNKAKEIYQRLVDLGCERSEYGV